jgi:hypothetical protein
LQEDLLIPSLTFVLKQKSNKKIQGCIALRVKVEMQQLRRSLLAPSFQIYYIKPTFASKKLIGAAFLLSIVVL